MNIHRNPLNGRNFEYISEDPYLTGWISAVQILGMEKSDVTGTIKHFCGNNQESKRHTVNAVVSERALREIYLKGYEIAVKEGGARSIMSTYTGQWYLDCRKLRLADDYPARGVELRRLCNDRLVGNVEPRGL